MSHLIWIYTVCHSIIDFRLKLLFVTMDVSKFRDGKVFFRNSGVKGLNVCRKIVAVLYMSYKNVLDKDDVQHEKTWCFPSENSYQPVHVL